MTTFSNFDIIRYVEGNASADLKQRIDQARAIDRELAAMIDVLSWMPDEHPGFEDESLPAVIPSRRTWPKMLRKSAIAVIVTIMIATVGWGGYEILTPAPLLKDDFSDKWINPKKWVTARRITVEENCYLRLNNRGSIRTVQEFPGPIEIEFDWRWRDLAGDSVYRDSLTVSLHSSGEHSSTHPFRVTDGIEIAFQAHGGQVDIASIMNVIKSDYTPTTDLPMPHDEWHHIRIVDDGKSITVYLTGPALDKKNKDKPVLGPIAYQGHFKKHHIVIHNREMVAGAIHESHIDNVVVRALPAKK